MVNKIESGCFFVVNINNMPRTLIDLDMFKHSIVGLSIFNPVTHICKIHVCTRSIPEKFQRFLGSVNRFVKRFSCSSSDTEYQYLIRVIFILLMYPQNLDMCSKMLGILLLYKIPILFLHLHGCNSCVQTAIFQLQQTN